MTHRRPCRFLGDATSKAMLDQLATAAGYAPQLPSTTAGGAAGERDPQAEESIREFLDAQRLGWGAKFGAVFECIGIEAKSKVLCPVLFDSRQCDMLSHFLGPS